MTFEEWWDVEVATKDKWVEDLCRSAWDAAYEQGAEDSLSVSYMAGLKDASSRKLPEGYRLVPVEPTEKMVEAGLVADTECPFVDDVYKAMIQAAQEEE